jgi:hypothetical protein
MRITSHAQAIRVEAVVSAGSIFKSSFRNGKDRFSNSLAVPKNGFRNWHETDFGKSIIDFAEEHEVDVFDPQTIFPVRDGDQLNDDYGFNPLHEGMFVIGCSSLAAPRIFRDDKLFTVDHMPHGLPLIASLQLSTDQNRSRIYARLTSVNYL